MAATSTSQASAERAHSDTPASAPSAPQVQYHALSELAAHPASWWQDVLGAVLYGAELACPGLPADIPLVRVPSEQLGAGPAVLELWRAPADDATALISAQHGRVRYRQGRGLLFAAVDLAERAGYAAASDDLGMPMGRTTQLIYRELFETLSHVDLVHPLRLWNYVADIHRRSADSERYAQFNAGRQDAFLQAGRRLSGDVPAASVLGVGGVEPLTVYALASRQAPLPIENPRQCSAWDYPRQYSERRPTFARACLDRVGGARLFISGTASILGHRSEHHGDPVGQTRETLQNIRALLVVANELVGETRFSERALAYKVYVRHRADQPRIAQVLQEELGPAPMRLYLRADVCRSELLVEIEATSV
jgi:enamine deaminase RidA (YjgF/YER057c/UK114 family)